MNERLSLLIKKIWELSCNISKKEINIMEVCGTHTHVIYETGIRELLSKKIKLISGPGCPVCVTHGSFVDNAIEIGKSGATIVTFGDIAKVRGTSTSLWEERKNGVDLKIIYSLSNAIQLCKESKEKVFVFLGIGFETTAPLIGTIIERAYKENIKNLYFYNSIKTMPPILEEILTTTSSIDGLILPGHVAVIQGENDLAKLFSNNNIPGVIAGFTFEDMLLSIYYILRALYSLEKKSNDTTFRNIYKSCVTADGNIRAKNILKEVFQVEDGLWRGIGYINKSALVMNPKYKKFNAIDKFSIDNTIHLKEDITSGCRCTEVIMGKIQPNQCTLFKHVCNSENPLGPCMVSVEGSCYCAYKFEA
ncbi:hydrogenase formation protein HypD [Clostridium tunisiense]|uniref:hydrogenase formation protein HypD n=1 Tax=Clostridium tunisiense TaxID=219748 RepID=UPI00037D7A29|nr:hydrogenase formation protein HypD [Clostridium tunisiense]